MTEVYTGIILEGKSLYVPREPAKRLESVVAVQNFQQEGIDILLLSTRKGYWNRVENLVEANLHTSPFTVLRWMIRYSDVVRRIDLGFCLDKKITAVETYVPLPDENVRRFVVPNEPTYVKIVPENDCLAVLKSADLSKYFKAREAFYEKTA